MLDQLLQLYRTSGMRAAAVLPCAECAAQRCPRRRTAFWPLWAQPVTRRCCSACSSLRWAARYVVGRAVASVAPHNNPTTQVRSQDAASVIGGVAANRFGRALAWTFIQERWDALTKVCVLGCGALRS